jgi:hypothetical protein
MLNVASHLLYRSIRRLVQLVSSEHVALRDAVAHAKQACDHADGQRASDQVTEPR